MSRSAGTRPAEEKTILVIGGSGYFGQLLIDELLRDTDCRVIVGGRSADRARAACRRLGPRGAGRLVPEVIDLHRRETIVEALRGARVAICAAGPFQGLPSTLAELCIERGVHYIDLSDDRIFVGRVRRLALRHAGPTSLPAVCPGWSAVPSLSGLLARIGVEGLDRCDAIRVQIAPGNGIPRGRATVASLLASVGRPFTVWRDGRWQEVTGWSGPRGFDFPPPIGRRLGYLVDVPDLEIFPKLFGAGTVEFRVGSELGALNAILSMQAWLAVKGVYRDWARWATLGRGGMALLGFLGHAWGAVGVEVSGSKAGKGMIRRVSVVADRGGHRIPVMPAAIMTAGLISGSWKHSGLVPVDTWLDREGLQAECDRRGYRLVVREEDGSPRRGRDA